MADIVTVSDSGTHEKNAVDFLYQRILMAALKAEVNFSGLSWRVGDEMLGKYPNRHVRIMLPPKAEIQRRMVSSVKPFLHAVRKEPLVGRELVWDDAGVDFRLSYDPARTQAAFGGAMLATAAYSLTENPLYDRLNEKAHALRQTGYSGLTGVIAVDGDCYSIRSSPYGGGGSYDARKIVARFLAAHPAVSFVTTTYCEYRGGFGDRGHHLYNYIHFQQGLAPMHRQQLESLLRGVFSEIPKPQQSPSNAIRDIVERREIDRGSNLGSYESIGSTTLSIPVRVFLGLVARTLTERDLALLLSERTTGFIVRFFKTVARNNLPFSQVSVRQCENEDDDWITFEIGSFQRGGPEMGGQATRACDLPISAVLADFATLDQTLTTQGQFDALMAPTTPKSQRDFIEGMLAQGRLLERAQLIGDGAFLRLLFGVRDAAVAPYC